MSAAIAAAATSAGEGAQLQLHPADVEHQALVAAVDAWASLLASPHTRRAYRCATERLIREYGEVSAATLAELRDDMADQGVRPATIRQSMIGVLSCTRWLADAGFVPTAPRAARARRPAALEGRPDPEAPTPAQVIALHQIAPATAFRCSRCAERTPRRSSPSPPEPAPRVSELVALDRAQVQYARPTTQILAATPGRASGAAGAAIDILGGKGDVDRTVPAGAEVIRAIKLLSKVAGISGTATGPVVPALAAGGRGGRLADPIQRTTARTVARILGALGDAIDLPPGTVYPHALRHAYALAQLDPARPGAPLSLGVLQRRLGHASPATTARYLIAGQDPDLVSV